MSVWLRIGIVVSLLGAGGVNAQSVEETYANLCSDPAAAQSETCAALRQALMAKLQAQSAGAAASPTLDVTTTAAPPLPGASATPAGPDAETLALWQKRWGLYLDMLDKTWGSSGLDGYLTTFKWKVPGEELDAIVMLPNGSTAAPMTTRWDEANQRMVSRNGEVVGYAVAQPDGSLAGWPESAEYGTFRSVTRRLSDGSVESVTEKKKKGDTWVVFNRSVMVEYTPEQIAQEQQQRLAAAKEEQERKQSRGSIIGTLLVAGAGAATANAYGGSTEQILGGALKGAQIANADNSMANALGSQADSMITGGAGNTGDSGSGAGSVAAGSYPTKPNLATRACTGFTEANYRQKALSGGGDQQLYTMCGQAFEFYTMYKRAIAQGYSEADANRTYAAHEQSARGASSFLSSHGAN